MDLLENIKGKTHDEVITFAKELNLNIKEYKNIYMLSFNYDADFSNTLIRQANGIILEKNTNKLLHYSFPKCYEGLEDDFLEKTIKNEIENSDDFVIELYFDGSMIKLYYYDGVWNVSTSKHLLAKENKWTSKKSFDILFKEAIEVTYSTEYEDFLDKLDKNYCYTFLLQHPENHMIVKYDNVPVVYEISRINLETLEEERVEKDFFKSKDQDLKEILSRIEIENVNYMLFYKNSNNNIIRVKLLSNYFNEKSKLRGKYPDIGLTYIQNYDKVKEYDKYYPEFTYTFMIIDKLINKTVNAIHKLYVKKYINKIENLKIPQNYEKTLVQLHGQYKRTREFITLDDTYDKIMSLDPRIVAYIIGYKY